MNEYIRKFQQYMKLRNYADSTFDLYNSIITGFLYHFKTDPRMITTSQIGDFILTKPGSKTKRQTWYILANFYANIIGDGEKLKYIPLPKQEKYIPETLNHVEVMRIINAITNIKHRAIITLIYACGLRISESVNVKISDIDGIRLQCHIKQSKGAKDRIIPIPIETINLLREYYKQYKPKEYLFNGQNSLQYDIRSIQQVFHRAKCAAGIYKKVTVHSLRHSRATELLRNGVDISLIQKFLGHSNIKTTQDFYIHTNINDLSNAIGKADVYLMHCSQNLLTA